MDPIKTPANDPPRRNGNDNRTSGNHSVRGEINVPDEDLVTTVMRAAEEIAAPLLSPPHHPIPQFATPEDYDESVLPHDFDRLLALTGQIRALMAHDPKLARQAAYAREAFGDGETLKILFRRLFPGQHTQVYRNPDGSPILTPREVEVLTEAAKDLGRDEIAARLNITPRTAATHLSNIYAKLHVQRPMQAVARAISMGYLDTDVLGFIQGAGNNGARNFRLFDTTSSYAGAVDHAPYDAPLRPLAEFALLLLILVGRAAQTVEEDPGRAVAVSPALLCELDPRGRVVRSCFGRERLLGRCGIAVAPPSASRHGFTPGHLFAACQLTREAGLNRATIHEFTPEGRFVRTFCGGREIGTRLTGSSGLGFHPDGRLLVPSGSSTDALLAFRKGGAVVCRFANIIGGQVCAGPANDLYAIHSSSIGCQVRVYDRAGALRQTLGQSGVGVNYGGLAVTSRGHVWVNWGENEESTLVEFGPDGALLRTVPVPGLAYAYLAVDKQDRLYVPCPRSGDIKILTAEGKVVERFDLHGRIAPSAVAVGDDGRVWVSGKIV